MNSTVKKEKGKSVVGYILGSIAIGVIACLAIPKIMPYVSGFIYKKSVKKTNLKKDDDDWGPVIEKKNNND